MRHYLTPRYRSSQPTIKTSSDLSFTTRDLQWAIREDPLFEAAGVHVEISVPGLTQANAQRPLEPYLVMLQQVMDAVARLPYRRLHRLDKKTWRNIVELLSLYFAPSQPNREQS